MELNERVEQEEILPLASKKLSDQEKIEYCLKWEKSKLSKVAFCKAQNISLSEFKYWYRVYSKRKKLKSSSQWSPVVTNSKEAIPTERTLQLELVFPHQLVLRVVLSSHHAVPFIQELFHAVAVIR